MPGFSRENRCRSLFQSPPSQDDGRSAISCQFVKSDLAPSLILMPFHHHPDESWKCSIPTCSFRGLAKFCLLDGLHLAATAQSRQRLCNVLASTR